MISTEMKMRMMRGKRMNIMIHTLAEASHAPDTNVRVSGASDKDMTSPVCPVNDVICWPLSISQRAQVMSPEDVTIWLSSRKRQQDKYPV